jgi:uncharacterized membrane protein/thiol-disulfide isomerase/thioredoxin
MLRGLRWLLIASLTLVFLSAPAVQAEPAVVRAVLFYSPTCPHCHQVINEDLPPLFEKYGDQLYIIGIDISQPDGQVLFQAAIDRFKLEHVGVPTLVVDDVVLIGSLDIPEQFPGLIEKYLAQGGTDWPTIPGLIELINTQATPEPTPVAAAPTESSPESQPNSVALENSSLVTQPAAVDVWSNVTRDPIANGLAIVVLCGMIGSVAAVVVISRHTPIDRSQPAWREWAIPVLCLIGLGVAGYLAYVEAAQVAAVCGPVGDCNTVQQSEYARLFGVLPIGVLGLIGYVAIIVAWGIERWGRAPLDRLAALALVLMTFGGTAFSIYLTFLEPFVIGATCAWCLTSAILMTALLWLTVTPRRLALIQRGSTS